MHELQGTKQSVDATSHRRELCWPYVDQLELDALALAYDLTWYEEIICNTHLFTLAEKYKAY